MHVKRNKQRVCSVVQRTACAWLCVGLTLPLWYKAGFSAAPSVVEAAAGVLSVAAGCTGVPPRCCPVPPVLKSRPTEGLTLPSQWRWKISAIVAFGGWPSFSFPPLQFSSDFSPPVGSGSRLLALLFLFSFSFFCSFGITWRGRRAGGELSEGERERENGEGEEESC